MITLMGRLLSNKDRKEREEVGQMVFPVLCSLHDQYSLQDAVQGWELFYVLHQKKILFRAGIYHD